MRRGRALAGSAPTRARSTGGGAVRFARTRRAQHAEQAGYLEHAQHLTTRVGDAQDVAVTQGGVPGREQDAKARRVDEDQPAEVDDDSRMRSGDHAEEGGVELLADGG